MDRSVFQQQFGILGDSEPMRQVTDKIKQVADTDIAVLILGETGTGKDVTARAIHANSKRKHKNLVIVNCGAIPEGIIESELFGHEKGSFTGAGEAREGYFEKANGGTIFLDEIADTPKAVQVKLLRVLESGEYFRVGSSTMRKTDVRVIAATNKDLWQEVQKEHFREDLYHRIDTVTIKLPPLRDRAGDIVPLFRAFVTEYAAKHGSTFQGLTDDARSLLVSYRWPGNVRELRKVAERLVVLEKSQLVDKEKLQKYLRGRQHEGAADNLPMRIDAQASTQARDATELAFIYRALIDLRQELGEIKKMIGTLAYAGMSTHAPAALLPVASVVEHPGVPLRQVYAHDETVERKDIPLGISKYPAHVQEVEVAREAPPADQESLFSGDNVPSIEETEQYLIKKALKVYNGNRRKASEALGVSERTLYRKLDQYGLV
jgi:transcriptional regulator with PAS, ATPase and Fis domain